MNKVYVQVFETALGGTAHFTDERAYKLSPGSRLTDGWFEGEYMVLVTWPRRMRKQDAIDAAKHLISWWASNDYPPRAKIAKNAKLSEGEKLFGDYLRYVRS